MSSVMSIPHPLHEFNKVSVFFFSVSFGAGEDTLMFPDFLLVEAAAFFTGAALGATFPLTMMLLDGLMSEDGYLGEVNGVATPEIYRHLDSKLSQYLSRCSHPCSPTV